MSLWPLVQFMSALWWELASPWSVEVKRACMLVGTRGPRGRRRVAVGRVWEVASSVVGPGSQALLVARGVARVRRPGCCVHPYRLSGLALMVVVLPTVGACWVVI